MNLFGKKPTPEEYVKKWKRELQHEQRNLERTIRSIQMEEQKTKIQVKQLAKKVISKTWHRRKSWQRRFFALEKQLKDFINLKLNLIPSPCN